MSSNTLFVNSLLIGMVITGTLNTLVYKYQNTTEIDGVRFNHPYMQALCMFLGEAVCIFLYWALKNKNKDNQRSLQGSNKKKASYLVLAIPALFDGITSSLQHIALNFIPSSIYQMLRGGVMIVTAIFSRVFLKKKISSTQKCGVGLTFTGIVVVGFSNFAFSNSNADENESSFIQIVSVALVILSLFSQGAQYVTEEKIFENYEIHTFMVVGGEGLWGLLYFAVVMPILNFTPCNFNEGCVFRDNKGYWECTDVFLSQLWADAWLFVAVLLGIISIALFNLFGVNVTKHVSALARTVVDTIRTVLIWGIGLIVTVTTDRKWENTNLWANLLELLGFSLLVLGNMVYKGLIKIPFLEQNKVKLLDEDGGQVNQSVQ